MRRRSTAAVVLCSALLATSSAADGSFSETRLTASDAADLDEFGAAVAITGDTIAVGAVGESAFEGAVYVFERGGSPGAWSEVERIKASDAEPNDSFGFAAALDGDTLVVGAPGEADPGFVSGAAYVFERNLGGPDAWGELLKLESSDIAQLDNFGFAVDVSGDTIVVGAYGDDETGPYSGSAYVFERNLGGPGNWGESKKILPSDPVSGKNFAWALAVDGDTIVVGAWADGELDQYAGAVYVFERDAGGPDNWGQVQKRFAPDGVNFDELGRSVDIDGDHLVAGMFSDDDPFHKSGSAYIFERDHLGPGNWGMRQKIQHADAGLTDWFGWATAISGERVVSGAHHHRTPVLSTGAAYLFLRDLGGADAWGQAAKLEATDREEGDQFGHSVAVDGETIVVGAHWEGALSSGAVYVYEDDPAPGVPSASRPALIALALAIVASSLAVSRRRRERPAV